MEQRVINGVLSFIAEGIIVFSEDGKITFANPHANLLLDYTESELIGTQIDKALHLSFGKRNTSQVGNIAHRIFFEKKVFTIPKDATIYLTSHSGKSFPIFVAAKRLVSAGGEDVGVVVFRNISSEKTLEEYHTQTAERLSELTPILQRTAIGDFSTVPKMPSDEDEFTELFVGLRLMIEDLRELVAERENKQITRIVDIQKTEAEHRHLAEEYSQHLEEQVVQKTREIMRSKTHIETLIENLTSGLLEYDNTFTLLRVNHAAEKLLGVSREEVVGQKILPKDFKAEHWQALVDVTYPSLAPASKKVPQKDIRQDVDMTEMKVTYPAERELHVTTISVIAGDTHERQGFIKIVRDITREKNISRSKNEFISIAAHQLRTPLSAIKWVIHMVINGDLGPLTPSQKELLTNGYETNEKMIHLVNDLLNVARIEDGRFGYSFKKGDVMKVLESVVESVKGVSLGKHLTITVTANTNPMPEFAFDASKLSLVLQNLVDNAVKYTPEHGTVTITVSADGENATVRVQDTGIGVPKDQINRLFTKFFRADNALHMQTSGSGLGLYLAKNIVVRHGGTLTVSSTEGAGSVFTVTLPLDVRRIPQEDITVDDM